MPDGGDYDFSVFLSDVNLHVPHEYSRREDLRSRVLLNVVLAEPLIVADSHSLNSPMLRSLFVRQSGSAFTGDDLGALLRRGDLRVSRRDRIGADNEPVTSFVQIQADHLRRHVDNVPPPAYGEWLDEVTAGRVIEYSSDTVAANFKTGFLARLDQQLAAVTPGTPPGYLRAMEAIRGWAGDQESLLYRSIRERYAELLASPGADRDTREATDFVERSASASYHLAVPLAIAIAVAGPRSDDFVELPSSIRATGSQALAPGLINPTVWQHVPVDAVAEILELDSRQKMLHDLADARSAGNSRVDPLMGSVAIFAEELNAILERSFAGRTETNEQVRASMRRADLKARVTAVRDESNGATGLRIHPTGGASARNSFDVLHMPVPVTDTRPWVEQDDRTETPNHRVVAGTDLTVGR